MDIHKHAIVLAMIALLIGYEAVTRLIWPVAIDFNEAIPIAVLGLIVNVASVLLLSGRGYHRGHSHGHGHGNGDSQASHHHEHDQAHSLQTSAGPLTVEIFEDGVPPRFRLSFPGGMPAADGVSIETIRPEGAHQCAPFRPWVCLGHDHVAPCPAPTRLPDP